MSKKQKKNLLSILTSLLPTTTRIFQYAVLVLKAMEGHILLSYILVHVETVKRHAPHSRKNKVIIGLKVWVDLQKKYFRSVLLKRQ